MDQNCRTKQKVIDRFNEINKVYQNIVIDAVMMAIDTYGKNVYFISKNKNTLPI